ncbi:aldehyde dehydrogenase family protein, partial [Streptomyces mirabilis]|uniref:aldehyde dehydrogenase family protein n=1 Tax=Streptomyces mirabilis TaxID=68239 RepID=UPI0036A3C1AC
MRRPRGRAPCGSPFDGVDHAVEIANDTEYGLAGHVAGTDLEKARAVARRIRAGGVAINDAFDFGRPFDGYKKSGNGREWGEFGFHDYLETKGILGQGVSFTGLFRPPRGGNGPPTGGQPPGRGVGGGGGAGEGPPERRKK